MDYADQLADLRAADPALGHAVAGLRNLEAILNWAPRAGVSLAAADLVQQDEFNYDFLIPVPGGPRWLGFGLT